MREPNLLANFSGFSPAIHHSIRPSTFWSSALIVDLFLLGRHDGGVIVSDHCGSAEMWVGDR